MCPARHTGYARRSPVEVISYAVWLYFRFPPSLSMMKEVLAARGIEVNRGSGRQRALEVRPELCQLDSQEAPDSRDKCWDRWPLYGIAVPE